MTYCLVIADISAKCALILMKYTILASSIKEYSLKINICLFLKAKYCIEGTFLSQSYER